LKEPTEGKEVPVPDGDPQFINYFVSLWHV